MTCTYIEAIDEMYGMLQERWASLTPSIVDGEAPKILYIGQTQKTKPPADKYYARMELNVFDEFQATFKTDIDGTNSRRYTNHGILLLHIFCPFSDAQNSIRGNQLGIVARDSYRGKRSDSVVFYNCKISPWFPNEVFNKIIVSTEYKYDDVG